MKQIVDQGGVLLLGSGSGAPTSYYDGNETKNASLSKTVRTVEAQACGDTYSQTDVTGESYELSATVYYEVGATGGLFAIGSTCYATYKDQQDSPVTLFAGTCTVTSIGDTQTQGDYEMQNISLRSSGAPDTVVA